MIEFLQRAPVLILMCAVFYAGATWAMKVASLSPGLVVTTLIAFALAGAVAAEVILMRQMSLPIVYIAILVAETLIVLSVAAALGEAPTPQQLAGMALVLTGAAVIWT